MPFKPVDTALKIIVGQAIDDTDMKSREEGLTYDQAGMEVDVILEKHDGTIVTTAVTPTTAGDYDWTHTDQGYYSLELPASGGASFNNTEEGIITVAVFCTGVLPFRSVSYDIVPTMVYDSIVKGTDKLEVDTTEICGDSTAANNAELAFDGTGYGFTNCTVPTVTALTGKTGFSLLSTGADLILKNSTFALAIADAVADEEYTGATHNVVNSLARRVREIGAYAIHSGTAQAGNATCITLAATASAIDGTYNRNLIVLTDNTGVGQTRTIIDYDGSTKIATIDREWRTNPDATSEYQVTAADTPLVVDQGVAQAGSTSSTIKLRAYASSINDTYLCNIVILVAGTGRGQARLVGAYDGTSKVVTLCGDNWVTTPDDTSVYVMIPYGATCTSCVGDDALAQINAEIGMAKNVALPKFDFYMVLSSDHVSAATGKTVTGKISKDGGAFAAITNSITEVSDGMYTIASGFTQTEMNADVITLKFTCTGCDQRIITIYTT